MMVCYRNVYGCKPSDQNDGFLPSFVIYYDYKASDQNDGFLPSYVIFYDYKASDFNDGLQASFVILTVFKHQISKKAQTKMRTQENDGFKTKYLKSDGKKPENLDK